MELRSLTDRQKYVGRIDSLYTVQSLLITARNSSHFSKVLLYLLRALIHNQYCLIVLPPIQKVLHKNKPIQQQRPKAPQQPREVNSHIPRIRLTNLPLPTPPRPPANRRIRHNTQHIRQIPYAGKQEKQHRDPLGALAAIVKQQLRDPRPEIEHRANIAKDLAPDVKLQVRVLGMVLGQERGIAAEDVVGPAAHGEPPAQHTGCADEDDGAEVEDDGLESGRVGQRGRDGGWGGVGNEGRDGGEVGAVDGEKALAEGGCVGGAAAALVVGDMGGAIAVAVTVWAEEGSALGGSPWRWGAVAGLDDGVGESEAFVIEALSEEHDVG